MDNPPILLSARAIEKEVKPSVYSDIKGKSDEEVKALLMFYVKNCLNYKITNASYNYSHCRAVIDVICYFRDWDIPTDVAMNDTDRMVNPDLYYSNSAKPKATKRTERKVKDEAACRTKASTVNAEPVWVVKDVRKPNLPSVEQILKFNEARNSRT